MNANVNKTNGVKLLAVVAVLAMVVCAFAALAPAEQTDAATNETQYYSGTLDKTQDFSSGTNVIIDKNLTIKTTTTDDGTTYGFLLISGATLTINSGVTVTIDNGGVMYFAEGSTVINNGNIVVKNGGVFSNLAAEYNATAKTGALTNNGSIEVQRGGTVNATVYTDNSGNAPAADDATGTGNIIVPASGSINTLSTKATPSTFNNQKITMAVGATVDFNSKIDGVEVNSDSGSGIYTYGEVQLAMTSGKTQNTDQETSNVSFSVTSERIADAYYNGEAYSRATAYILDISGSLGAFTEATINATDAKNNDATASNFYYKTYGQDTASDVPIKGTVSVTDSLDVNANTTINIASGATVNVSGSVDIAGITGNNAAVATAKILGIINVSGQVTIDSVIGNDKTVDLKLKESSNGAYLNIMGEGTITIEDYVLDNYSNAPMGTNGVTYTDNDGVFYVTNLSKAIEGATAANNDDTVSIWGYNASARIVIANPYVFDTTYDIPSDVMVYINTNAVIAEGVTITLPEDSIIDTEVGATFTVEGELMDYTMSVGDTAGITLVADVMSMDADETYYLYTSLANAMDKANEGDTIELYGDTVTIDSNLTIKTGVTVDAAGNSIIVNKNIVMTVDGILDLTDTGSTVTLNAGSGNDRNGSIILNNMIILSDLTNTGINGGTVPGFYVTGDIGDYTADNFVLAPEVAATNSATIDSADVRGELTYSGELTFTAAEDATAPVEIVISGSEVTINKMTLDGYTVSINDEIEFNGTVEIVTTEGNASITFTKADNYVISVVEDDSGETTVTRTVLDKVVSGSTTGSVTIASGTVELADNFGYGASRANVLTVSADATLVVPDTHYLLAYAASEAEKRFDYSAITVDGTISFEQTGYISANSGSKPVTINGTMTVTDGTLNIPVDMTLIVNGTLAVSEVEDEEGKLTVNGTLFVGSAPETLGATGTVTGPVDIASGNHITVYSGSSIEAEKLNIDTAGNSAAVSTTFYINGVEYMTVYANGDVEIDSTFLGGFGGFEIIGYDTSGAITASNWYTTPDYQTGTNITETSSANIGDEGYESLYFKATPQTADVIVSIGSQISVFIDGIRVTDNMTDNNGNGLSVGEHTIVVTINPGFTGETTITFNGQTVTDGKIVVTPDMAAENADDVVLSVTGNLSQSPTVVEGGDSNDGMGLTDYLLIILVVLIVIMAIMVAMRLMRS